MKKLTACLERVSVCDGLSKPEVRIASCLTHEQAREQVGAVARSRKNNLGEVSMWNADKGSLEGSVYAVNDRQYVVDRLGRVYRYDQMAMEQAEKDLVVPIIREQIKEDAEVEAARGELAKLESRGDAILESVLKMHLWYTGGSMTERPEIKDGISFYQVGRNASHDFYCGVKDGQRYVAAYGDYDPDSSEPQDFEHIASVHPVETFAGQYLGHC